MEASHACRGRFAASSEAARDLVLLPAHARKELAFVVLVDTVGA
jgi:hypothetical protein